MKNIEMVKVSIKLKMVQKFLTCFLYDHSFVRDLSDVKTKHCPNNLFFLKLYVPTCHKHKQKPIKANIRTIRLSI